MLKFSLTVETEADLMREEQADRSDRKSGRTMMLAALVPLLVKWFTSPRDKGVQVSLMDMLRDLFPGGMMPDHDWPRPADEESPDEESEESAVDGNYNADVDAGMFEAAEDVYIRAWYEFVQNPAVTYDDDERLWREASGEVASDVGTWTRKELPKATPPAKLPTEVRGHVEKISEGDGPGWVFVAMGKRIVKCRPCDVRLLREGE